MNRQGAVRHLLQRSGVAVLVTLVVPLCVLSGCRASSRTANTDGVKARLVSIAPSPPRAGPARLVITLTSATGAPIAGAKLHLEGDMSMAGMVPETATLVDQGQGRYASQGFAFTMAGDWVLTVSGTLPSGQAIMETIPLRGVRN